MQAVRVNQAGRSMARSPGRPRDTSLDAAILAAAIRQLGEQGYAGMSVAAVAAAAGTTPPSLRRRYRDKLALALAGIDAIPARPVPPATGQPRADALAVLENFRDTMVQRDGLAAFTAIVAERRRHPELLARFQSRILEPRHQRLRAALAGGVASGQLPPGLDPELAVSVLTGGLYAACLNGQRVPRTWAARTLGVLWPACAAAGHTARAGALPARAGGAGPAGRGGQRGGAVPRRACSRV
jgi:AcrR family transcriptional regulator